jgi:polyisoprenyl-teichoic acid--peptidoglycan teichoic acid transferase
LQNWRPGAGPSRAMLIELALLFSIIVFGCGALYFAFQIYDTVREAVLVLGVPNLGDLPSVAVSQTAPTPIAPNVAAGERVNVLLLGIDRRPSEKCPCRTDTMMLATLDSKTLTAGVVTIPRDLYVEIPGIGENRINTANFLGESTKYPGGGPALAKKTVEYNLGRRVHYYVLVDFSGFRRAIDALGGIYVDVPKAIDDPTYPDENFGFRPIHIPAGHILMNGEMALEYARTRHADSDFGRSKRQIQVMMAARDRVLRPDILPKIPALLQSMWGLIETDIKLQDVITLAQIASKVKTENIKQASIDDTMTIEYRTSVGADVLWPDRSKIGRLMDQMIPQDTGGVVDQTKRIQQEGARVLVLNGTTNAQTAKNAADYLQAQGFQIAGYGNADRFDYAKTVLIDYSGAKNATVTALAKAFSVGPDDIRPTKNVKSDVDIRLIVGADWKAPTDKP